MNPKRLYFDNAATSFPKPDVVVEAMARFSTELGASPGRGAYSEAAEAGRLIDQCRQRLVTLFNGESPDHIVFTLNGTDALNLAIRGVSHHFLRRGESVHLIATDLDHNSVLRPFNALRRDGVEHTRIPCDPETGVIDIDALRDALRPDTRLVAMLHGSNVSGTVQPIEQVGAICREREIPFLVDAAQTLGHLPIDVQAMHIDLLAFPGHKGLLGPLGTGGLAIRPDLERIIDTVREGGTGSVSEQDVQPDALPDRYEPGSHNAVGLAGLNAATGWILEQTVEKLWRHEQRLIRLMLDGLRSIEGVRVLGPQTPEGRCGVFSIRPSEYTPEEFARLLEDRHGLLTRAGLHCAPGAHRTFGTFDAGGAVRLSLGPFLTDENINDALGSIKELARERVGVFSR